jgi:hypothetical protein
MQNSPEIYNFLTQKEPAARQEYGGSNRPKIQLFFEIIHISRKLFIFANRKRCSTSFCERFGKSAKSVKWVDISVNQLGYN